MRTKLFIGFFLLTSVFFFIGGTDHTDNTSSKLSITTIPPDKQFIIGVMDNGWDRNYIYNVSHLNLNTWHKYTNPNEGWIDPNATQPPWIDPDDVWNGNPSLFGPTVEHWISENNSEGLRTFMDRPIIEYLAYGQRSDYQAEAEHTDADYWFYTYTHSVNGEDQINLNINDIVDNDPNFGNGEKVKHCVPSQGAGIGYILKDLRANREQANKMWNPHNNDDTYPWYVKPRIRIDPDFVDTNPDDPVCKIEVLDWNGDPVIDVDILAKNFTDGQGNYDGRYLLDDYNFIITNNEGALTIPVGDICPGDPRKFWEWGVVPVETDFRVHWYGTCEMWIDYVRVENEPSVQLHSNSQTILNRIQDEVDWALDGYNVNNPIPNNFYIEEYEFNITPSLKKLGELIAQYSQNKLALMSVLNFDLYKVHVPDAWNVQFDEYDIKKYLVDGGNMHHILINCYPLEGWSGQEDYTGRMRPTYPIEASLHPYTLSTDDYDALEGILSYVATPDEYEEWLQDRLDNTIGGFGLTYIYKFGDRLTKIPGIDVRITNLQQAHLWWQRHHKLKEPTNEEIELMANLAIGYGAKGLMYFLYTSSPSFDTTGGETYFRGIIDDGNQPRDENVYGQDKFWQYGEINEKYQNWGPYLASFDDANRHSYIYRDETERDALVTETYIQDVVTYKPGSGLPACEEDNPGGDAPPGYIYECKEDRYLQVSTFNNPAEDHTHYFMILNRRASYHKDAQNEDNWGGRRKIKIKFTSAELGGPVNWKLYDLENGALVTTFNSQSTGLIDLGDFMPGQGKLYRMVPVIHDGGTLVADEVINDDALILDTVWTDGFNLTIEEGQTITFDTNGVIVAEGGNFICGDISGTQGVDLLGTSEWNGIKLIGCDTVKVYNTTIEAIKDSLYAIDMYNCRNVEMEGNVFTLDNSGAVRGSYVFTFGFFTPSIVLYDNTVNIGANILPVFNFNANSASSFPVIIDECDMNAPSSSLSSAISIINITGGVIKNNEITGYNTSVLALSSAMDFYNNIISSSTTDCILSGSSGSTLGLKETGGKGTGGENFFSTSHEDANNVEIYGGYFFAENGYNTFDIGAGYDDGKHFSGYFAPEGEFSPSLEYNCFTEDGSPISPVYDVTWDIAGDPVSFDYTYDCTGGLGAGLSSKSENNYHIIPITDRYNDTIKIRDGNFTLTASDSMSIEMRKRNYGVTIDIAERILENSPGSPVAYDAVNKLYLASLRLDSAGNRMTPLKAFLEQVILDNGDKPGLVSRTFYFIQKCKAALGQYQSALTGFGDIVTNNPNTYDALVASWDYAATTLLMGNGQGGGEKPVLGEEELFAFHSFSDDPKDQKLSKEQKQQVKVNVIKSFEETRKEEINVINKLKEKSDRGDKNAQKELKRRETLQAVVTKRQPEDIYEHINNVSSDIRVIFNSTDDNSIKKEQNSIPVEFELSQNFPNPFNPRLRYSTPYRRMGKCN